ncbi:hypothetical protein [Paenibacillus caui]|uniref:hypothetical protein n=1 Tax=Paenibacillus caui TaxID=2873927 RepID=UPI001CA8DD48|nr:hypothetical protein [Paenibacillus caui]
MFSRILPDSTYEDIQREAREVFADFSAAHKDTPGYADSRYGIEFGIYLHEIKDGVPVYVQFGYRDHFEINQQDPGEADVFGVAAHSDIALPLFVRKINSGIPIELAALRTFESVADEVVGGYLTMFAIGQDGITCNRSAIKDRKPVTKVHDLSFPYTATMDGSIYASKLTAKTANISESNFKDGAIIGSSINVGNGQFTVDTAGNMYAGNGTFRGSITSGSTITGALITGGRITSDTDINITRDIRVGNNIYLGLTGQTNDRRIEFVDSGPYHSYIAFTDATKQLEVYAANDLRITSGLDVTISAMRATLPYDAYLGSSASSNKIAVAADLASKADIADLAAKADRSEAGYNLAFDTATRNLKMYSATGSLLATVNIPA